MPVGFRSFLSADPHVPLLEAVVHHVNAWSAAKGIAVDAGCPGRHIAGRDDLVTVRFEDIGGASVYRWRRERRRLAWAGQMWRTTFTALRRPGERSWLWTEIEPFEPDEHTAWHPAKFMSAPMVMKELLSAMPFRDGRSVIAPEPQDVSADDLPDLMDYLADDTRRGPIFVVSEHVPRQIGDKLWAAELMADVVGLGMVFVLGPGVDVEFNEMMGRGHAVYPGTVRTYLPKVNLDDPLDRTRHLTMSKLRIDSAHPRRLSRMLGVACRERVARSRAAFLPAEALDVDRALTLRENRAVAA